VSAQRPSI